MDGAAFSSGSIASGSVSTGALGICFTTGDPAGGVSGSSSSFFGAFPSGKASSGLLAIAARMKSIHIGSAARAPVSFSPSVCRSSKPIHVPQVTDGENPMNHASV